MDTTFTPVSYDFRETIQEQIEKKTSGKIFYWEASEVVGEKSGSISALTDRTGYGMFIILDSSEEVRIDKIITLFGKPGAAFDEYDAFANACLSCTAGVPL